MFQRKDEVDGNLNGVDRSRCFDISWVGVT